MEKSLKSRAIIGSAWSMGAYGGGQVLRIVGHIILAWLLSPAVFGLMALVRVVQAGLNMFSDIGITPSIIQSKRGNEPSFLNTAWTIQVIRGICLSIVTCILAWPFAWWYAQNDPAAWQLAYILPVVSVGAIIDGIRSPKSTILKKELRLFGRLAVLGLGTRFIGLIVMVVWALLYPSVWALVAGGLTSSFIVMCWSHFLLPGHRVRLGWDHECSRELLRFGKWIFFSTIFTFFAMNMDKLVLGKMLTIEELGLYSIALIFATVALEVAGRLGSGILFPVYSKLQSQPAKLMDVALRAREAVLYAALAVCVCLAVGAPLFFETLFDQRYHQVGTIAQWLTFLIWSRILLATMDRIPLALGNSRALFFSNIIQSTFIAAAIGGYVIGSLPGFILGLSIGPLVSHLFLLSYVPNRKGEMLRQSLRFTLLAVVVGGLLVFFTLWVRANYDTYVWVLAVISGSIIPALIAAWIVYNLIWGNGHSLMTQIPETHKTKSEVNGIV